LEILGLLGAQNTQLISPKKTSARSELRSEDSGSVPQLVALIEQIRHVEPELEQTVFFWQMKFVGEA
jgi:hypothetical protein